jgi:predicted amidohydrolase
MAEHEIVLRGGRVIDPESGFDAVADVAIGAGRIVSVGGLASPSASVSVDVAGLVVTAGFVDLHSHVNDLAALTDRATYADSTQPSAGMCHVLVNGAFVVRDGSILPDARPGRPVRAEPR